MKTLKLKPSAVLTKSGKLDHSREKREVLFQCKFFCLQISPPN